MTPIFQTSTYVQESPGTNTGYGDALGKNHTRVKKRHIHYSGLLQINFGLVLQK
jgi:hypothetical protein